MAIKPITAKAKKEKKQSITFKVDAAVAQELDELRQRVRDRREKVEFNFDLALQQALVKVIKQSNKALDAIDKDEHERGGEAVRTGEAM